MTLRFDRRKEATALDPSRTGPIRSSIPMLLAEYVFAYARAVWRAPLSPVERLRGFGRVAEWILTHVQGLASRDPCHHALDIQRTGTGYLPDERKAVGY